MSEQKLILLLQPWVEDFYMTDCRIQPIGLAYLAGSLKQRFPDFNVRIYDALAGGEKRTLPWPREFEYLQRYYGYPDSGPFSLFHQFYRFGKSENSICQDLNGLRPFLIGISCLFTPYYRQSMDFAFLCRELFPGIPIVMGGSHATMQPKTLLRTYRDREGCNFILSGEAEHSICELVEMLLGIRAESTVNGLITLKTLKDYPWPRNIKSQLETRVKKQSLNTLAVPSFQGINADHYTYNGKQMSFLITSRSCPHRCSFCSIHSVFGTTYRIRSVKEILAEIRLRYRQGIRHFDIEDDNFTVNKKEVGQLLEEIIEMKLPITFTAMNGLSYISLNEELLTKMRVAGFSSLNLSLVSSDKLVLKFTDRPHTVQKFNEVMDIAKRLSYRVTAYFILGLPLQTISEMWRTLCVLACNRCLVGASPFYFTPGSPIHVRENENPSLRLASSKGGDPYFSARLTAMDLECEEFNRDDIYTLFRLTRVFNYIKKGLDQGHPPESQFYAAPANVLRDCSWFATSRKGKYPLPFSKTVANLIQTEPLTIAGYQSNTRIRWNPSMGIFQN